MRLEIGFDETDIQPGIKDRGGLAVNGARPRGHAESARLSIYRGDAEPEVDGRFHRDMERGKAGCTWSLASPDLATIGRLVDESRYDRAARQRCLDIGDLTWRQAGDVAASIRAGRPNMTEQFQRLMAYKGFLCSMS